LEENIRRSAGLVSDVTHLECKNIPDLSRFAKFARDSFVSIESRKNSGENPNIQTKMLLRNYEWYINNMDHFKQMSPEVPPGPGSRSAE
jgi:hypothetical protein